ncbi:putative propionate catabolism operon transcriptional regulator of GntR family [gamma proteobacterium IMCC1989]|nr:putative propionate catabolism operon transcriptional regulator of GntR family [gamma proteobacterium IMCC1989]
MNKASDQTITSEISEKLINAIVNGEIAPGSKLSEPKLAQQFNISRGPLREAIRRLEGLNLVYHVPREGVKVVTLELKEIIEIYHVREALEGLAAGLAARNMEQKEIDELHKLLELHEQYIDDNGEYFRQEGDFDFHYKIIQGSKNQLLIKQLCHELYHLVRMFRYQTRKLKSRTQQALIEHKQLVNAIEQRDEQLAELLMRRHISRARENIESKWQENET